MKFFFIVLFAGMLLLSSCVTDEHGNKIGLKFKEAGLRGEVMKSTQVSAPAVMKAQVKGSIYETGEAVTVYGTCLDAYDAPLTTGTYATISAWYPNGTVFFSNTSMMEIQAGYYAYFGTMSDVSGTYLTELRCHSNATNEVALAWGEWQNPNWVRRIGNLTNVTQTIVQQINNTDILINATYQNLSQQITYAAAVANASVDRNDSYLATLLTLLMNWSGVPSTYNLTVTEYPDDNAVYMRTWEILVRVKNEYNVTVGFPLVSCFISTNNVPAVTNEEMTHVVSASSGNPHIIAGDPYFTYSVKIGKYVGDFNWTTTCSYN
jgi:hypothetical protein